MGTPAIVIVKKVHWFFFRFTLRTIWSRVCSVVRDGITYDVCRVQVDWLQRGSQGGDKTTYDCLDLIY